MDGSFVYSTEIILVQYTICTCIYIKLILALIHMVFLDIGSNLRFRFEVPEIERYAPELQPEEELGGLPLETLKFKVSFGYPET